ncbi:MAG: RagB/SusD family nutrient uptake outer membrane protein [Muribaculaceae bacterium]|nr:RagB/SusD family nutrient uptake outer membrane protein [Muribaculaceae bacterium]
MKINNILKGLGIVLLAGSMTACSSDYLDLTPDYEVSADDVTESESSLTLAAYGMISGMYCQYYSNPSRWTNWFNGEPMFLGTFGEATGQDFISYFWEFRNSNLSIVKWSGMDDNSNQYDYQAWMYCYNLISLANNLLPADTENVSDEAAFRMAQAYTIRAHGYVHLLQVFAPRWQDSNNGATPCLVLRTLPTNEEDQNSPLVSMNTILDLIYSDLDRAIELYEVSGWNRDYYWEPDIEIAYGIYSRAALIKNDWQTAYNMSKNAMEAAALNIGADMMDIDEYATYGFNGLNNSELIWASSETEQNLYWWSSFGIRGCNGGYVTNWAILGGGAIDYNFYKEMYDPNDIRAERFFTPDKVSDDLKADFWDGSVFQPTAGLTLKVAKVSDGEVPSAIEQAFVAYSAEMSNQVNYDTGSGGFRRGAYVSNAGAVCNAPFGAHYKFWCNSTYGSGAYPFMRYSELVLNAAEAAYQLGNVSEAQNLITTIQENRIENYAGTTQSGTALYDYIKNVRRWELWGEGFNFFDFKRWNQPIVRNGWVEGDTNSGNWDLFMTGTLNVSDHNGWRWTIPEEETNYNNEVSPSGN